MGEGRTNEANAIHFDVRFSFISSSTWMTNCLHYLVLLLYYRFWTLMRVIDTNNIVHVLYDYIFFFFASRLLFAGRHLWSQMSYRNTNNRFFVHSSRIVFALFESILFCNVLFKNGKRIAYKYSLKYKYLINNEIYSFIDEVITESACTIIFLYCFTTWYLQFCISKIDLFCYFIILCSIEFLPKNYSINISFNPNKQN